MRRVKNSGRNKYPEICNKFSHKRNRGTGEIFRNELNEKRLQRVLSRGIEMLYKKFAEELTVKIKENGSSFTWEAQRYELVNDILWLVEKRRFALFTAVLERSRFLVRVKTVKLEPVKNVAVQADWTADRYILACKYDQLGTALGLIKSQLDELRSRRQELMKEEAACQEELNKVIKGIEKYAD